MAEASAPQRQRITSSMRVLDVLAAREGAADFLSGRGLPCTRCVVAETDDIGTCLRAYGLDVEVIVGALDALP